MNTMSVVQLRGVTKRIGSKTIVDHLSFDVMPGEVFGFLGPNGAGKTTTIRMMVGLMSLTEGEVLVNGLGITKQFEQAMMHIGAIVENPEFYKFMTGYQNLQHFARMIPGITPERLDEVVALVKLEHRIHDKVKTYSLGMRQRLGVAQAILHRPAVLILDEPTNGLDPEGIRELRDYLRRLSREENIAVIVSSHLLSEMELMCDRVAIIQNGKLLDVRSFRETQDGAGVLEVLLEVDRLEAAARAAASVAGEGSVLYSVALSQPPAEQSVQGQDAGSLTVHLRGREEIAELNARLVEAGIRVYGIRTQNKSLEEQFLEVTRGNQIV
ncbi:ABC transporter ATP-binding protein [Paenibacillus doosanensis]|uniref:ABC transporter ATP-binding protein YxlF n=1 Tax=Paenibacillus konkukensis TaxID=2020716 RepID=A0ABY4RTL2_9BACL|nr:MULTISPECIES: ABC transporter ATP-binding protein [Paenibacillus]MCS7460731.1 ABC transporter ATP-binding protein [Paenibacillus doosanensis]UQZ85914.1 putative ABC transporter ATP-binding protein YxlF [Paenibacillus konkukensis]